MNDSLASYWNTPGIIGAQPSSAMRKGWKPRKQSACRSIPWGLGEQSLHGRTQKMGQQGMKEHSLGRHLPMAIFPKTTQDRKHRFFRMILWWDWFLW